MKKGIILVFISIIFGFSNPWGRNKGEFFSTIQFYRYTADKYWDNNGDKRSIGCTYKKNELALYGEYGFTERTTLLFRIPYVAIKCGRDESSSVGDIELGFLRKLIEKGRGVLSIQTLFIIPSGYSIRKPLRVGYGRFGVEAYMLSGYGLEKVFLEGGIGFRYYAGYPSEQIRAYGRVGFKPSRRVMIMNTLEMHYGLGTGKRKVVGRNITLEPNYKLLQNDLFVTLKVTENLNWGLGWIESLWGRNVGVGRNVYTQIWLNF